MDIASRIKFYMNSLEIGSSQFADTCQIPRPTLSQILNGRNKKISDEIIGKIHEAYPQLSVLWLMFGEGEMLADTNTQISEPQTGSVIDFEMEQVPAIEHFIGNDRPNTSDRDLATEKNEVSTPSVMANAGKHILPKTASPIVDDVSNSDESNFASTQQTTISLSKSDGSKRIVSIMVFYDDNSFESFSPTSK